MPKPKKETPEKEPEKVSGDKPVEDEQAFIQEQADAMADLMDFDSAGGDSETAQPASQEQQSAPEAKDKESDATKVKETEDKQEIKPAPEQQKQAPEKDAETKPDDEKETPAQEQPPADQPEFQFVKSDDFDKHNFKFEAIMPEGVRQVDIKQLVTTYQQHGNLQKKHERIKPIFDMFDAFEKEHGISLNSDMIWPYLQLGIQTAHRMQTESAGQPIIGTGQTLKQQGYAGGPPPGPASQQYQGPFKDQGEDDYYKEYDPALHERMWNLHNQNAQQQNMLGDINTKIQRLESNQATITSNEEKKEIAAGKEMFNNRINEWAGSHDDYFKGDPGKQRKEKFIDYLVKHYSDRQIKDFTNELLSVAFAGFDPAYYSEYLKKLSAKPMVDPSQTFAEGEQVRAASSVQLDEQQQHMADLLE